ncbi:MAG: DUF732 domain-containing protein [Gammaproteobacteria bacterium]|nr:MAG: DUF732 domain-containing protein [Gammaproteobacteria bacterium]
MLSRNQMGGRAAIVLTAVCCGVLSPQASASPPGPGEPGYCGAHTSPLNCWADTSPIRPGEAAFISRISSYAIPGVPTDSNRLLQIGRGTCQMLTGGVTTEAVVDELASTLGKTKAGAGQILAMIMDTACPGLTVGADGVARPAR